MGKPPNERAPGCACPPIAPAAALPAAKPELRPRTGTSSCRCRKEKYRISPLQPTPPPAPPSKQGCSGPLGCPAASASGILPFCSTAPCRQRTSKFMCSKSHRCENCCKRCEAGLKAGRDHATHEKFRPTVCREDRPTREPIDSCPELHVPVFDVMCVHAVYERINDAPHRPHCRCFRPKH